MCFTSPNPIPPQSRSNLNEGLLTKHIEEYNLAFRSLALAMPYSIRSLKLNSEKPQQSGKIKRVSSNSQQLKRSDKVCWCEVSVSRSLILYQSLVCGSKASAILSSVFFSALLHFELQSSHLLCYERIIWYTCVIFINKQWTLQPFYLCMRNKHDSRANRENTANAVLWF